MAAKGDSLNLRGLTVEVENLQIDGTDLTATAAELNILDGVTATAAELNVLDGQVLPTEAGAGITDGTGTVYRSSVTKVGDIKITRILLDLTGLTSADTDVDVIGEEDTSEVCHLGQITAAVNGTIFGGTITCLELPASLTDIDFYAADEGDAVYEDLVTSLTNDVALVTAGGAWAAGDVKALSGVPAADQYLYVTNGVSDTPDIFTAGKFLIELYGYDA